MNHESRVTNHESRPPFLDPRLTRLLIAIAWIVLFLLVLHALSLLAPALRWILKVVSPFLVALVAAYILDPVVNVVQRRFRLGRIGGLLVLILAVLVLATITLGIAVPLVVTQMRDAITGLHGFVTGGELERLLGRLRLEIPPEIIAGLSDLLDNWQEHLLTALSAGGLEAASFAGGVLSTTLGLALAPIGLAVAASFVTIIAFYLLLDFDRIPRQIDAFIPVAHRKRTGQLFGRIHTNLSGFLRGQLLVCVVMGAMITVGLLIVGPRKYAFLIGLLAGAVNFIPYLGPVVGALPALAWALLGSGFESMGDRMFQAGLILLVFALAQAIDGFVVSPKIIGDKAKMHPLLVMLALLVGAQGGLAGMIVAVPVMIIAKALFVELVWTPQQEKRALEKLKMDSG